MKIGCIVDTFLPYGEERYRKMKACGFDYADANFDVAEAEFLSDEAYLERFLHDKRLADEAGVVIHQVHGPWRYPPHDETPELRARRLSWMQRSIRATGAIGVKNWVIHPLMPFGTDEDFDLDAFYAINEAFFRELLVTAKACDVTICFENMPMRGLSVSTPEQSLKFIHRISDDRFHFCLDTGHCAIFGISPADAVRMAGKDLCVLHVHDNGGRHDDHFVPYAGMVDWKDFRRALDEIGFDGVYSLECSLGAFLPGAPLDLKLTCLREIVGSIT